MKRPKILPYIQIVAGAQADTASIYGHRDALWNVSGTSVADLIHVVPYLDGTHSCEAIASKSGVAADLISEIVAYLERLGMVSDMPPLSNSVQEALEKPGIQSQALFLSRYDQASCGHQPLEQLALARVAVVSAGAGADHIRDALIHSGVGEVLTYRDLSELVHLQVSLAVVIDAGAGPGIFQEADRVFRESAQPWLRVVLDNEMVIVGPLFIPFATACYNCYELRLSANWGQPESDLLLYRQQLLEGRRAAAASFMASDYLIAGIVGGATVAFLSQAIPCEFVGQEYSLNLVTLDSELRPLLQVPGCPVCTALRPSQDHDAEQAR